MLLDSFSPCLAPLPLLIHRCCSPSFPSSLTLTTWMGLWRCSGLCDPLFGSPLPVAENEDSIVNHPYDLFGPLPVEDEGLDLTLEPDFDPYEGLYPTSVQSEAVSQVVDTSPDSAKIFEKCEPSSIAVMQPLASGCKRTCEKSSTIDAQQGTPSHPSTKKQKLGSEASVTIPAFLNMSQHQLSIPSHVIPTESPRPSASAIAKEKFAIETHDIVEHHAREVSTSIPPDTYYSSPYQPVGYNPSAPSLHAKVVHVSNEALQHRLANSRRRADAVTADRNKIRDTLLRYTAIDPKTGKLGLHALESQLATLRRVNTNHQRRAQSYQAEIDFWKQKFTQTATTYNSLLCDYRRLQSGLPSPPASSTSRSNSQSAQSSSTAAATTVSHFVSPAASSDNEHNSRSDPSATLTKNLISNSPPASPQNTVQVVDLTLDCDAENEEANEMAPLQ